MRFYIDRIIPSSFALLVCAFFWLGVVAGDMHIVTAAATPHCRGRVVYQRFYCSASDEEQDRSISPLFLLQKLVEHCPCLRRECACLGFLFLRGVAFLFSSPLALSTVGPRHNSAVRGGTVQGKYTRGNKHNVRNRPRTFAATFERYERMPLNINCRTLHLPEPGGCMRTSPSSSIVQVVIMLPGRHSLLFGAVLVR